jgi:hypothetical protein
MTLRTKRAAAAVAAAGALLAGCGGPSAAHPRAVATTTTGSTTTTTTSPATTSTTVRTTTTTTTVVPAAGDWTTYGGDEARSAVQARSPALDPLHHLWTSPALDGAVYGEPLIWHGTVYAATENDTVYALSARSGAVEWSRHLATPAPAGDLPCGDISPTVGITSAMVLDPARDLLFASAETLTAGGGVGHELAAIDPASGAVRWARDLGAAGPSGGSQLQRTGLGLDAGQVLVGFGGNYGDCGSYHGWLLGVPESGTGPIASYQVPTQNQGAIWAPAGVSVDPAGDIYLATGNGSAQPGQPFDHGDAVIELSPALHELGYFAPTDWAQDNVTDEDLGSTAPVLVTAGGRDYVFEVGKETVGYLLAAGNLGGIGGAVAATSVCFAMGGDAWVAPLIYVGCPNAGVTAVRVGAGGSLTVAWTTSSGAGGPPTVASGLVWSVDAGSGTLDGLSPVSGSLLESVPIVATEHFAAPAAGEGLLVVGGAGSVEAFAGPRGWVG